MAGSSKKKRKPRISPDGKFYWDGQRWVPFPREEEPKQGLRARLGMTGAVNSLIGYGCLAVALIFVIGAIGAWCGGSHTSTP
jgi:hypothetical protein